LRKRLDKNKFDDIPVPFYELKNGKVALRELFWLDKGFYTYKRYNDLYNECKRREYNVTYYGGNWEVYSEKPEYWNDYEPTVEQVQMIRERIVERLKPLPSNR
jgi:hypothetical protein